MTLKKSPSGSLCPYYYKGGELHPLHYGGYRDDTDRLYSIIEAEEKFILSSLNGRYVWIDLYESKLTENVIIKLSQHINNISQKIVKIALVGCSKKEFKKIVKRLKNADCGLVNRLRLFDDPEKSKDWLVGL